MLKKIGAVYNAYCSIAWGGMFIGAGVLICKKGLELINGALPKW